AVKAFGTSVGLIPTGVGVEQAAAARASTEADDRRSNDFIECSLTRIALGNGRFLAGFGAEDTVNMASDGLRTTKISEPFPRQRHDSCPRSCRQHGSDRGGRAARAAGPLLRLGDQRGPAALFAVPARWSAEWARVSEADEQTRIL